MRVHILQHVSYEGPGCIEGRLGQSGDSVLVSHLYESDPVPDVSAVDGLIVMGGPMSVNDLDVFPWMRAEMDLIQDCIDAEKPVLGICLGAQLIARVLGSNVRRNNWPEIGWFPVHSVVSGEADAFRFPDSLEVFHWHGETFDLPAGSIRLAASQACENQAFQFGKHVIGLQFHLEITPDSLRGMVDHGRDEMIPGQFVQDAERILSVSEPVYETSNLWINRVLDHLRFGIPDPGLGIKERGLTTKHKDTKGGEEWNHERSVGFSKSMEIREICG